MIEYYAVVFYTQKNTGIDYGFAFNAAQGRATSYYCIR